MNNKQTFAIFAYNRLERKREQLSMNSTFDQCHKDLDHYRKMFGKDYTLFKVAKAIQLYRYGVRIK